MGDQIEPDEISWGPCRYAKFGPFYLPGQGAIQCQDEMRMHYQRCRNDMLVFRVDLGIGARLPIKERNRGDTRSACSVLSLVALET